MSFRARLALVATAAVGLAVVAASAVVYVVVRDQLLGQVDRTLLSSARQLTTGPPPHVDENGYIEVPGPRFGGERYYLQAVPASGPPLITADLPRFQLPVSERDRRAALGRGREYFSEKRARGVEFRVFTLPSSPYAIQLARPLTEVNRTLHRITLFLILIAAGGIAVAT